MNSLLLKKLVSFLNHELSLSEFPRDESANGLQVEGSREVRKIGLAVDACDAVFEKAAEQQVDFLLVHHGLIWGGVKSITGILRKRIKVLIDHNISLYACHLPLDWHPEYGNNVQLLRLLGLRKTGEFGEYHGKRIGYRGHLSREISLNDFKARVDKKLGVQSQAIDFNRKVKNIGIVSGGGWSALHDAEEHDIDTFLTGEPSHSAYTLAEELKINLIFAGHYATETLGVRAAGEMLSRKFSTETVFVDHPTGL
ncbi:MAG: Nif3-like dinuclear metal center hexameric protein [Thermodesulfovibrio sp.]|nr:Nif3-like dinuclear metal center hexameric protein [Thermodesulfovibrio sp.]